MSHAVAQPLAQSSAQPQRPRIPPLENGDHLTRAEFERRYDATPGLKKAELIEGVVYMPPPPVSHEYHSRPHTEMLGWLMFYRACTPHLESGDNGSLRLDLDNMPQPDAYLLISPAHGGQAKIDEEGYVLGAPELTGEVAASSASFDLHLKKNVYRRAGVREYVVWRTYDREIDYFVLREGNYELLSPDPTGLLKSEVFPGLWLDRAALLNGDVAAVSRAVQQGAASPEHANFVSRLTSFSKT